MFTLSLIFVIVCSLFEWKPIRAVLFIDCLLYVLSLEIQEENDGILLTGLTQPHLCVCPKPGPGYQASYVVVFVWSLS